MSDSIYLVVGDNVVFKKSDNWIPGVIVSTKDNYSVKPDDSENIEVIQVENIRLSVLIKCESTWVRADIIKKENSQYLVKFDKKCPETNDSDLVDLDKMYVLEKVKNVEKGEKYLVMNDGVWSQQKNDDTDTDLYVEKAWIPHEPVNIAESFLEILKSNIPEDQRSEALDLFKKIMSNDSKIKKFEGSNFKIDGKSYSESDDNILNIADMLISYLAYSKIKITSRIKYHGSGNNFYVNSTEINKIVKITNDEYENYESDSDYDSDSQDKYSKHLNLDDFNLDD